MIFRSTPSGKLFKDEWLVSDETFEDSETAMPNYEITNDQLIEIRKLHAEDKIKAIKETRRVTGLGLREAKELVEGDFSEAICEKWNLDIAGDTPGYYIDRIFALSKELTDCYSALKSMGFKF